LLRLVGLLRPVRPVHVVGIDATRHQVTTAEEDEQDDGDRQVDEQAGEEDGDRAHR